MSKCASDLAMACQAVAEVVREENGPSSQLRWLRRGSLRSRNSRRLVGDTAYYYHFAKLGHSDLI